jgi:hypothetical protein
MIAVGNPFGLGGTVTARIVSTQGRDVGSDSSFSATSFCRSGGTEMSSPQDLVGAVNEACAQKKQHAGDVHRPSGVGAKLIMPQPVEGDARGLAQNIGLSIGRSLIRQRLRWRQRKARTAVANGWAGDRLMP